MFSSSYVSINRSSTLNPLLIEKENLTPEDLMKFSDDDKSLEKLHDILMSMECGEFWKLVSDFERKYNVDAEREENTDWQYTPEQIIYEELLNVIYYSGRNWNKEFSE